MMIPQKRKSPVDAGLLINQITDAPILADADHGDKALKNLQATFALLGHALQRTHTEGEEAPTYWVSRWGHARPFKSLNAVREFLIQIGGSA